MIWYIILGYVVLLIIQYFSIQAIIPGILGSISPRNKLLFWFIGSVITWLLLSKLWLSLFGYEMPLLALILSLSLQEFILKRQKNVLTESSKMIISAEVTAIILVGLYILIFKQFNWV